MAKSKNGGTRAFIRGRIGSDVYSVGKDGKGSRQQVVRSLAEQVSNPRTSEQMFGRMVMSTVMQAVSALKPIIDHSFDGLAAGQPSISEFIRRNYALVKADAIANPNGGNSFGLNKYQEKGVKAGKYIISNGSVQLPSALNVAVDETYINLTADTLTVGGLKAALGLSADGYLTQVVVDNVQGAMYCRLRIDPSKSDDLALTADNVASVFLTEGNYVPTFSLNTNAIMITPPGNRGYYTGGLIVSEKIDGAWAHSTCVLAGDTDFEFASRVALPTYPTGSEMFLNGGQL